MTIEAESIKFEVDQPSSSQLDKIVESLGLLINMQVTRDQKEQNTLASIESQLESLRETVDKLTTQREENSDFAPSTAEFDNASRTSILADYGLVDESTSDESIAESASEKDEQLNSEPQPQVDLEIPVDSASNESELAMCEQDAREIEAIKEALRQKLREAEIESSIKRADLIQRQATIEEREAQLGRAQRLKQDTERDDVHGADKPKSILARLKKQLHGIKNARPNARPNGRDQLAPESMLPLEKETDLGN